MGFRLGCGVARIGQSNQKGAAADSGELFKKITSIESRTMHGKNLFLVTSNSVGAHSQLASADAHARSTCQKGRQHRVRSTTTTSGLVPGTQRAIRAGTLVMSDSRTSVLSLGLLAAGTLLAASAIWAGVGSNRSAQAQASARTCVVQYDTLLLQAKQALARSDRSAALELLLHARQLARQCADLQDQESTGVALADNTCRIP